MWNITSFTDFEGFAQMPNNYTGGWFWSMMLFSICVIIFILTRQKTSSDRAFATTGFGAWIFGTFLFFLGWINWFVYAATIFLMIGGIIAMIVRQEQEY
jgi:hypothetical protein